MVESPGDTPESSPTPQLKSINSSVLSFLYRPTLTSTHDYGKKHSLTRWTFVCKVMSLLFNMLSRLVIAFLPRRKHLLISWLQSPSAVILEPKTLKSLTVSIVSPSICHEVMGLDAALLQYNSITLLFYAVNVLNYMFIHRVNTTYICNYCFMWSSFKKEKKIYTQTYLCCNLYLWIHTHTQSYWFSQMCVCVCSFA